MNKAKKLNDLYNKGNCHYWCNAAGDINIPGSPVLKCGEIDEMPPVAATLYEEVWTDCGLFPAYVFEVEGRYGMAFSILFDESYIQDLNDENETIGLFKDKTGEYGEFEVIRRLADALADKMPLSEVYCGKDTDPDGHEIVVFIPADNCTDMGTTLKEYMDMCEGIYHEFEGLWADRLTILQKQVCFDGKMVMVKDIDPQNVHLLHIEGAKAGTEFSVTRQAFNAAIKATVA